LAAERRPNGDVPDGGKAVPVLVHAVALYIRHYGTHGIADSAIFGGQAQFGLYGEPVVAG
jgi:hypothetical protein